jgi:hypothetical protein
MPATPLMLAHRLFPARIESRDGVDRPALWIFTAIVLVKTVISVNSIINGHTVVSTADGIPLDTYSPAAAQTIVSVFALLSLSNLMLCLLCVLAIVRYRAMIPLMFTVLLLQALARYAVLGFLPIPRTGAPPGTAINAVLLALTLAGLALSLRGAGKLQRAG